MNTLNDIHHTIFIYNLIAHLSLSITFQYLHGPKINIFDAIYSVGHFWISMAQLILFTSSFNPGISPFVTVFGVLGHSSLITYTIKQFFKSGPSFWNIWFLLGQIGMVYFYIHNQLENKTIKLPILNQYTNKAIFLITFYILFIYYIRKVITTYNITTIPLLLVTGVYFSFIYNYT